MTTKHTFLVALEVNDDESRESAERWLCSHLPQPGVEYAEEGSTVECWWVAEDDRSDGSDNDSAVFVTPGAQHRAWEILSAHGLTFPWNEPKHPNGTGSFEPPEEE